MSQTPASQPRTVAVVDRGKLDIKALVLLAILLAAGFILNFTVGKSIYTLTGGAIGPEFIISAFCLTILAIRPTVPQALVIGLISAAVIQLTTSAPGVDFVAEGVAAMVMTVLVDAGMRTPAAKAVPLVATFITTVLSGVIFMVIKLAIMGFSPEIVSVLPAAMLPVVFATAAFNAVLVAALYLPIRRALKLAD
ncbi:MAG: hypothetical protein E7001_08900 [Coriobacteriaceae bacterium]|nr:hypothetical protein [Coriobacteriaceae bacterium]